MATPRLAARFWVPQSCATQRFTWCGCQDAKKIGSKVWEKIWRVFSCFFIWQITVNIKSLLWNHFLCNNSARIDQKWIGKAGRGVQTGSFWWWRWRWWWWWWWWSQMILNDCPFFLALHPHVPRCVRQSMCERLEASFIKPHLLRTAVFKAVSFSNRFCGKIWSHWQSDIKSSHVYQARGLVKPYSFRWPTLFNYWPQQKVFFPYQEILFNLSKKNIDIHRSCAALRWLKNQVHRGRTVWSEVFFQICGSVYAPMFREFNSHGCLDLNLHSLNVYGKWRVWKILKLHTVGMVLNLEDSWRFYLYHSHPFAIIQWQFLLTSARLSAVAKYHAVVKLPYVPYCKSGIWSQM